MNDVLDQVKSPVITPELVKSDEPKGARVMLSVCACYTQERLTLITKPATEIAHLLGITIEQLEDSAITAMFTGRPVVMACYKQLDVAEQKLAQIMAWTPFLSRSCHSFELQTGE